MPIHFKFLVPLLIVGLIGCNRYPSASEAKTACKEWEKKGESVPYKWNNRIQTSPEWRPNRYNRFNFANPTYKLSTSTNSISNRKCELESSTNQYLGYEGKFSEVDIKKAGQNFGDGFSGDPPKAFDFKVVRHFRY